ncbi:MAG: GNAT family N-acetyltransferase [Clostridiales bacterium]|nr:GNAT family N-acetyltransferase [Clostridiales bacterium]
MKTLVTSRLILKPFSRDVITERYRTWLNDSEVYKYLETRGGYSMDMLKEYVDYSIDQKIHIWSIHLKENNKHISNIKIDPINIRHGFGEYGILLGDKTEWGKGYGKEASRKIIDYFFYEEYKLRKITLGVVAKNTNAVALYKKIGFVLEGVYKKHVVYDNIFYDIIRMAIFNPEYTYDS